MVESSEEESAGGKRRFEVGIEGMGGDYEHVHVEATSPRRAFEKAEHESSHGLIGPVNAYQAFDEENGVTHER